MNSYEENEMRKLGAKVQFCVRSAQNRRKTICANKGLRRLRCAAGKATLIEYDDGCAAAMRLRIVLSYYTGFT